MEKNIINIQAYGQIKILFGLEKIINFLKIIIMGTIA